VFFVWLIVEAAVLLEALSTRWWGIVFEGANQQRTPLACQVGIAASFRPRGWRGQVAAVPEELRSVLCLIQSSLRNVSSDEFLRRFLIHVLPKGLVRIRHFGLFANRRRGRMLARCRALLGAEGCGAHPEIITQLRCPICTGPMLIIHRMTSSELYFRSGVTLTDPVRCGIDSS
jgi:Putative transposase